MKRFTGLRACAVVVAVCLLALLPAVAQNVAVTYSNLESANWTPVVGASISSVAATGYAAVPEADGVRFYESGPAWAGVLWKHSCALPSLPAKGSVTISFDVQTDDAGLIRSQAREFDVMLAGNHGEVFNGSNQLNEAEGGHWQAVNASYKWQDVNFNPGPLPANTWVPISYTVAFDTIAQTSAVTRVSVAGAVYVVPAPVWIPAQALAWAPDSAVVQIQLDENSVPGAYSEKLRNITLVANW